jgi:PhnB protein
MPDRALIDQLDQAVDTLLAGGQPTAADPELAGLIQIAGALRHLPDDQFKTRLSRELQVEPRAQPERTTPMTATTATIHTVTPFISVVEGAKLIEFMKHTFAAEETSRHPHGPDGFVAAVKIGDSDLLIMGGESLRGQERSAALHVYVKDCDAAYHRALEAGAVTTPPVVGEPADRPYGERCAFVMDPFGNHWYIATRPGPNYVAEGLGRVTPYLHPANAPALIDFLARAFGAEEVARYEAGGRVMHAVVRIGEAMVEMGEADRAPSSFYMHTGDVDAVYHRAVDAGAISLSPPADQAFGDRMAVLQDPFGNHWLPATPIKNPSEPRL